MDSAAIVNLRSGLRREKGSGPASAPPTSWGPRTLGFFRRRSAPSSAAPHFVGPPNHERLGGLGWIETPRGALKPTVSRCNLEIGTWASSGLPEGSPNGPGGEIEPLGPALHHTAVFSDGRYCWATSGSPASRRVRIRGPSSVTAIVCSKCAASLPSAVTTVQPSFRIATL